MWVCWSSCGGWVGVPSSVLDFLGVGLLEFLRWLGWCSIQCFGLGLLADLGPGVVVCADLDGLRREARNEREIK